MYYMSLRSVLIEKIHFLRERPHKLMDALNSSKVEGSLLLLKFSTVSVKANLGQIFLLVSRYKFC